MIIYYYDYRLIHDTRLNYAQQIIQGYKKILQIPNSNNQKTYKNKDYLQMNISTFQHNSN